MYNPTPIDTSDVTLPTELLALIEQIAANVHDVWAAQRIQEGWTYGNERNDTAKTTPDLVPYQKLPEKEKEYDRRTALETIRLITKLGYEITKQPEK